MDGHICWTKWTIHTLCLPFYQLCYEHHIPMFYPRKDLCDEETVVPLGHTGKQNYSFSSFSSLPFDPNNFYFGDVLCDVLSSPVCGRVCWRVGLSMLDTRGLGSFSFL